MSALICILLFAAGNIVRDGWPSLGSTHGARAAGAALCGLGAFAVSLDPVAAALIGAAILGGFYLDMKHGDGQGADTPASIGFLFLSGLTSLVPLAEALTLSRAALAVLVLNVGFLKPGIWLLAWRFLRGRTDWFLPTRIAAGAFGAVIGEAVALLLHG
jgi:hypothetical protein